MDLAELYREGIVSKESADAIRSHLKVCPSCRKYYHDCDTAKRRGLKLQLQQPAPVCAESRHYAELSKKLRHRHYWQVVGTSTAIGAGVVMLLVSILLLTIKPHRAVR
jgi:predicted anti-sigma-YlaC factor YlaD